MSGSKQLTYEEIMDRFYNEPIQLKYSALLQEADILEKQAKKLRKTASRLVDTVDKEADKIANQLDEDCPNWRAVVIKQIKNT